MLSPGKVFLLTISALSPIFSVFTSVIATLMPLSRQPYALGRDGVFVEPID